MKIKAEVAHQVSQFPPYDYSLNEWIVGWETAEHQMKSG